MHTTTQILSGAGGSVLHSGELRWHAGQLFEFLATDESTAGQFTLIRALCRPGFDPPRHVHEHDDECFLVLDGRMTFEIGGRRLAAGPGTIAWLPRGVPHAFRIESERVELLLLITPPGQTDRVFREHSVPATARELPPLGEHLPDFAAMGADMGRAGIDIVGPPLEP